MEQECNILAREILVCELCRHNVVYENPRNTSNCHWDRLQKVWNAQHHTLKTQISKNFSKGFSWLEVLLARESRGKPRKSLCTPCDWNLHPWTSRQTESWETLKTQILKNILSIFHDWDIDLPVSRKKSLYGLVIGTCN